VKDRLGYFEFRTASPTCSTESNRVKYWKIIARNIKKRGWSLGWISAVDSEGQRIWIVDAHRRDGRRFIVTADEKLSAFVELEREIKPHRWGWKAFEAPGVKKDQAINSAQNRACFRSGEIRVLD
jgi:hypothetical protein